MPEGMIIHLVGDPNKERFEAERVAEGWLVRSVVLTTGIQIGRTNVLRNWDHGVIPIEKLEQMLAAARS